MGEYKRGSHTVYDIEYHVVWTTKYRHKVLQGKISLQLRELLRQGCEANGITIVRGSAGKDHVHVLVSCPPTLSPSQQVIAIIPPFDRSIRMLNDLIADAEFTLMGVILQNNHFTLWHVNWYKSTICLRVIRPVEHLS